MEIIQFINDGCSSLTASTSPSINALGLHMVLGLATIMMVWFGVQEALASAHGGPGFHMGKFLSFVMLISFAYAFVYYYDSAIPGVGYSLQSFIIGGTDSLVDMIGTDTTTQMLSTIKTSLSQSGPGIAAFTQPYLLFAYSFIQIMLAILSGLVSVIIAYGAIGSTVVGLLGPVFIPFLVIEKLDWLFWGWLKGFLGFAFYKVVAAAVLSVLGQLYMKYYASLVDFTNPLNMLKNVPLLVILLIVNAYMLLKIPALTATLFSGSTGGHDAGTGIATALMMKG
jgi:hypothetical protein